MATYTAPPSMSARVPIPDNSRKGAYWVSNVATIFTFMVFIAYSTWRAFAGHAFATYGEFDHVRHALEPLYFSPFYSPHLSLHWTLGTWPISPALYVLIFPLSFRMSCYYCRRAYYRAIFQDPGACAVKEALAKKHYGGEMRLPNKLFNFHRYALYAALVLVGFHWKHMVDAFLYMQGGERHFGMGLGTLIFVFDTLMLTAYTFSCHSFRHLIGGFINRFSRSSGTQTQHKVWGRVTALNNYHSQFFWLSLISVGLADLYVYLVSTGVLTDPRLF